MEENKISLLRQREIEMRIVAPLLRAFAAEFGEERTSEIARRVIMESAAASGAEIADLCGKGLESFRKNCLPKFEAGGALEVNIIEDTDETLRFDVTRCKFAELYEELGCRDIGELFSCDRDFSFARGFDNEIEFTRTKTLMSHGSCCDFCYRKHGKC